MYQGKGAEQKCDQHMTRINWWELARGFEVNSLRAFV